MGKKKKQRTEQYHKDKMHSAVKTVVTEDCQRLNFRKLVNQGIVATAK